MYLDLIFISFELKLCRKHFNALLLPSKYHYRTGCGAVELYDVLEPERIQSALERKLINFGHLIFTPSASNLLPATSDDPLTALFKQ
jgi:hypothetical protein